MRYSIPVKGTSDGQKLLKIVTKTGHLYHSGMYVPLLCRTYRTHHDWPSAAE